MVIEYGCRPLLNRRLKATFVFFLLENKELLQKMKVRVFRRPSGYGILELMDCLFLGFGYNSKRVWNKQSCRNFEVMLCFPHQV